MSMGKMTKPVKAWCVITPKGKMFIPSIGSTKNICIKNMNPMFPRDVIARRIKDEGYECVRVAIVRMYQ